MRIYRITIIGSLALALGAVACEDKSTPAEEDVAGAAQALSASSNVVFIGGSTLNGSAPCSFTSPTDANVMWATFGGCLSVNPATNPGLGAFTFSPMMPGAVSATSLAPFDTAVLNVASSAMGCTTTGLSAIQKSAIVAFVANGKKLLIFDSECPSGIDYSWLPFPFQTANPGALGANGTLTILEENTLSSNSVASPYYINASALGSGTDAVGDMNVMTTFDPNWCIDMSGTNALNVSGPVHTYAKYPIGTDSGLMIYNGMDQDYQTLNDPWLVKVWLQELQQPMNPSNLPCGFTVVGITLSPPSAVNPVGASHTVTAALSNLLGAPQPGVPVTFHVLTGPNAGAIGSCNPPGCVTDSNGEVAFTYVGSGGPGTDEIDACFTDAANHVLCSQHVTKTWLNTPPCITCPAPTLAEECSSAAGASVPVTVHVNDPDGDPLVVSYSVDGIPAPPPDLVPAGGPPTDADVTRSLTYGLGAHTVTVSVSDGKSAPVSCTTQVTVVDTTPPAVTCGAALSTLWPPNHNLINVGLSTTANDACDSALTPSVQVFADEDDETPTGDGTHSPDAKDISSGTLRLRSERKGDADGRVYLIVSSATDDSQNSAFACCAVTVTHDQSPASQASVSAQAAAAVAYCEQNGSAPPSFVPVGEPGAPILGPKQ